MCYQNDREFNKPIVYTRYDVVYDRSRSPYDRTRYEDLVQQEEIERNLVRKKKKNYVLKNKFLKFDSKFWPSTVYENIMR